MMRSDLIAVRFADEEYLLAPDVAAEVNALRRTSPFAALKMARRGRVALDGGGLPSVPGGRRVVASGETVSVPLMLCDAALAQHTSDPAKRDRMKHAVTEMHAMNKYTTLQDAQGRIAELEGELATAQRANAQLAAGGALPPTRAMADAATSAMLRDEAAHAMREEQRQRRSGDTAFARNAKRLAEAYRTAGAAG